MNALIRFPNTTSSLTDLIDNLFETSFFSRSNRELAESRWPEVDIIEDENTYRIRADMPGLDKSDIAVTVENGVLSISGEKREERRDQKDGQYSYYERSYGKFRRAFNLPEHIDSEHIEASYKNGVLELKLNKTEEAKAKSIDVQIQ
jgi:HSP20 family protein